MTIRARAFLWVLLAIGIAITCAVQFSGRAQLQTNLLAVLPQTERNPLAEEAVNKLANAAGNRAIFLIGHTSAEASAKAARHFAEQLRTSKAFAQVMSDIPPVDPKQLTELYLQHRYNLLGESDRAAFSTGTPDLENRLQRKLYAPFRFGLTLSPADDPFGFTDTWIASLPLSSLKLQPENGLLITRSSDKVWVLVSGELKASAYDNEVQHAVASAVENAMTTMQSAHPNVEVLRTGTVFYAGAARTSAEREVDYFGIVSLIGIMLMLYFVFRSIQPMALGLLSVGFGIGAAVAVTLLVYGEMHLITVVFGASLIGEAIDYAIQYFAAHLGAGPDWSPIDGLRRITPGLSLALATSLLGYAALLLAPFPVLSQIALFALVGLSAAWISVFLFLPALLVRPNKRNPEEAVAIPKRMLVWWKNHVTRRTCYAIAAATFFVAVPGWLLLSANDDVRLLVSRPAALVEQEAKIRELTGFGISGQFFLVEGATLDDVLAKEEALRDRLDKLSSQGAISGYQSLSSFVPSSARQDANRSLWQSHVFSNEKKLKSLLNQAGLRDDIAPQQIAAFKNSEGKKLMLEDWLATPISSPFRHLWLGKTEHGFASMVLPQGVNNTTELISAAGGLSGVTLVDKAGSITSLFQKYRQWGGIWLLGALCIVYIVLCSRYGWRQALVVLAPTALAMVLAVGIFGYLNIPITLFNIMGLMLVLGIGVNYAIFLREGGVNAAATLAGVLLSAATTLLSFGLLAFSSMPALSNFGLTLLIGIGIAVLLAPMVLSFESGEKA
jgi:predicted exporter